ncbi:MAG TPA: hypothetical protein VMV49_04420 [Candidatus Deferrimicrobium sp.]|nr:hypothetical protein [Candidatus Deferrimicrobium sp.]
MLERCPYYELCNINTRIKNGNKEYYCLGSANWEFCSQFQEYSLLGDSYLGFGVDPEIKRIAKMISGNIRSNLQIPLSISFVATQGEILYRDPKWDDSELVFIQHLVRYMTDSVEIGEFYTLKNKENTLFMKIHEKIIIICKVKNSLEKIIKMLTENLMNYQKELETYLNDHPISFEMETPEENAVLSMFEDLQKKLLDISPQTIIQDLSKIQDKISEFFSWNRIFYEISLLIEKLEQLPIQNELKSREKKEILEKIRKWQDKLRQTI